MDQWIINLDQNDLVKLLTYIRDWNTSNRGARVAQTVMHVVVRFISIERLLGLPRIKEVCAALAEESLRW